MIMISSLVVITPGYYLHCLRRLADQEPRYHYTIPGKHSVLSYCVMIVALCNYTCSLCNKLEWMVEGQLNPIISILIELRTTTKMKGTTIVTVYCHYY